MERWKGGGGGWVIKRGNVYGEYRDWQGWGREYVKLGITGRNGFGVSKWE